MNAAHPQRGHLAEADTGVGKEQDNETVGFAGLCELVDLMMAEVHALFDVDPGERNARSRIADEPIVLDGRGEDKREDAVDLPRRRGGS